MTPENQSDEKPTQADKELAVQLWDELNAPGEENPRTKLAFALAAQRQSWEKEKYDLLTYGANQAELIAKLEKEKAELEEWVRDMDECLDEQHDELTRLKSRNEELEAEKSALEKEKAGLEYLVEHEKRRADNIHGRTIAELEEKVRELTTENGQLKAQTGRH